jgi:hypothetical protein
VKTLAKESDKAEILRRLRTLRLDSRRRWGRMTSHQMICHLADSFRVLLGRMSVADGATPLHRPLIKWLALSLPVPWPHGIPTAPELDQAKGAGTPPGEFARDRADLEVLLGLVTAPNVTFGTHSHPVFGPMSEGDWLRWGYVHMDHHFRQFGV